MEIYFQNIHNYFAKKNITQIFNTALTHLGLNENLFSVNLRFVDENEIKSLNNEFRKIDKVTDVLSFPNLNFVKGKYAIQKEDVSIEDGYVPLGDIAICKTVAKKQAKEYHHSQKREVCFLALHGLLHLCGFDHLNKKDEKQMMQIAEEILNKQGIKRG